MPFERMARHWLSAVNLVVGGFLGGALAAPVLAALGWRPTADVLYAAYHLTCHQWAFRSFFLFGPHTVYNQQQLTDLDLDAFVYVGGQNVGWKMAICERDLAMYLGLLLVGLVFARRRELRPLGFVAYAVLCLPIAVDGFTQLFGWRESTWALRVVTGLVFGLASAWFVLPRIDAAIGLPPVPRRYAPDAACEPLSTAPRRA